MFCRLLSAFKQRSSWASSFATGLVGWNGLSILALLGFGYRLHILNIILTGSFVAILQVILLRILFFLLGLQKGLHYGAVWGILSGSACGLLAHSLTRFPTGDATLITGFSGFFGMAVGIFLSYFYRDDLQKVEDTKNSQGEVDFGRDAHWLEPFGFGAFIYLLVYLPSDFNLAAYVFIVGAMSGVYAAGASHFSPDSWKEKNWMLFLVFLGGGVQGLAMALLFRQYQDLLWFNYIFLGIISSAITYLVTFLRGRSLAKKEAEI